MSTDTDDYFDGEAWTCTRCDGDGEIMFCPDDICRGSGDCRHGDGMMTCPACHGTGEIAARATPNAPGDAELRELREQVCRHLLDEMREALASDEALLPDVVSGEGRVYYSTRIAIRKEMLRALSTSDALAPTPHPHRRPEGGNDEQ